MENLDQEIAEVTSRSVVVSNTQDVTKATAIIKGIKGLIEKVEASYGPIVERAHEAHKEAIAQRDKYLKPMKETKKKYEVAITQFAIKQEAEIREQKRLADLELAKIAEVNKQKLLDESKATNNEWEKEVLQEQAQEIKPITVDLPKKFVEESGVVIRKTWKARVVDESIVPRAFLLVNESALNQAAKQEAWRISGIMGIEFYEEVSTSVRG